jgi:DNA-directed RNA polymerase specialized sigma24 family protein
MNRLQELSFAEIARRTGISQTQVKRLVADAIVQCSAALRRHLGNDEFGA